MTRNPTDTTERRPRQPMNWPTAAVLLGLFGLAAFAVWICGGVATEWISQ